MAHTIPLTFFSIALDVPETAGVYCLFSTHGQLLYVGRSDTNLRERLLQHLPGTEKNVVLRRMSATYVEFLETSSLLGWQIETAIFQKFFPPANAIAPARPAGSSLADLIGRSSTTLPPPSLADRMFG